MSTGQRLAAADAREIANELVAYLAPACERIEVAGSLRRKAADVGDVELVAVSRSHPVPSGLLFEVEATAWDLDERVEDLVAGGDVERLLGKDRYTKLRHRPTGLQVDLFTVKPPASWGVIFLIRTGPADYSHWFVNEIRRRGFHVREGALHRGGLGCPSEGRGTSRCEVVATPEERDVYAAVGLPWVAPERRGMA